MVVGVTMSAVQAIDPSLGAQLRALGATRRQANLAILTEARVGVIVGLVAASRTRAEILKLYPYLEDAGITQALTYAAWRAEEIEVSFISI